MTDKIQCPNCGHNFDVEEALAGKIEAHLKAEFEQKTAQQAQFFKQEKLRLDEAKKEFEKKKEQENEIFKERLNKEKIKIEENSIRSAAEKFGQEIQALKEENEKKKEENRTLKAKEISLLQKEKALTEKAEEMELEVQKKLLDKQSEIEQKAREKERESMLLKEKEYQKQLEDQRKLIDEMKRKAEQGSMQMQGEVQELALEELLRNTYPFDNVQEVPKGIRGADCIQMVINHLQQSCGSIVYESKRTKNFSNDWISKLKQDQITCKADLAVIVTQTLPSDMVRFGEKEGVWICTFNEVKSLSMVLREILIRTQSAKSAEENKGEKMEVLYNYLTSNEFKQNVTRIVETYSDMKNELDHEKRAMQRLWKKREKQIDLVQTNVASLFGSINGIAGKELGNIAPLSLPNTELDL